MQETNMTSLALQKLPDRIAAACVNAASLFGGQIDEIRLRRNSPASITVRGTNVTLPITATDAEIENTVRAFCDASLYTHAETIREGFIASRSGFRVGIVGRAVVRDGKISSVADVTALNVRIPRRVPGCADTAYDIMQSEDFSRGLLVWSPPGIGKTTFLRELALRLASGTNAKRVAVVDTRSELASGIADAGLADVLTGYPRAKGIEIARRTLAAEIVVCDEIGNADDAEAILDAHRSGITVAASAHAASLGTLLASPHMAILRDRGVFGTYYGLISQRPGGYVCDIKLYRDGEKRIASDSVAGSTEPEAVLA